jgi:histidine ammonia-lyase
MSALVIDGSGLGIEDVTLVARHRRPVAVAPEVWPRLEAARVVVERWAAGDAPVYGLNTGLGGNLGHRLSPGEVAAFQAQLIRGRAVGLGPPLPGEVVRAALLVRANGIARGASGVSPAVLAMLVELLNRGVVPVVPCHGSIGAADLVPMAHIGLVLLGRGEAELEGEVLPGGEALARAGLAPLPLQAKDGLGLINASALTAGHAALVLSDARRLVLTAAAVAALACEGYAANLGAFDARTAALRPAPGQESAADLFRALLAGSALEAGGAARAVQDALSFRCLPQITGVALGALAHAVAVTEIEVNGAGDNPAVLDDCILSSGNFHTGALALAFDALALALAQLAQAGLARTIKLMSAAHSGLPRYLSPAGGACAGLVPLQKSAAALLAEIRLQASPACLDALAISDFVEDHAPHTPLAVRKLGRLLELLGRLVAIEAIASAQAVDLRRPGRLGVGTALVQAFVRETVPPLEADRETGAELEELARHLLAGDLARRLDPVLPPAKETRPVPGTRAPSPPFSP